MNKSRGAHREFVHEIRPHTLLDKWERYIKTRMEYAELRDQETESSDAICKGGKRVRGVLAEIRKMCPGVATSFEGIQRICQEASFSTPLVNRRIDSSTHVLHTSRVLSPEEVYLINQKYVEYPFPAFSSKIYPENI